MTATLTPEERKAARAQAERDRRERIKRIDAACERAGLTQRYADLVGDQRTRALDPDATGRHILFGTAEDEETDEQRLARLLSKTNGLSAKESQEVQRLRAKESTEPTAGDAPRPRRTRSSSDDLDAQRLAEKARELGAGNFDDGFTVANARYFLDQVTIAVADAATNVKDGDRPFVVAREGLDEAFDQSAFRAYAILGTQIKDVKAAIIRLTKTAKRENKSGRTVPVLWGRQFALLVLASLETNR